MDIDVTDRTEKALLGREEIEVELRHRGEPTPTADAVRKKLAAELDLDPLTIAVDGIYSTSGVGRSRGVLVVHEEQVVEEVADEDDGADETAGETEDEEEAADDGDEDAEDEDEPNVEESDDAEDETEEPDEDAAGDDEDAAESADADEDEKEDDS